MEELKSKIPENLKNFSKEELILLLESIRNDIKVNKVEETVNKSVENVVKVSANEIGKNLVINKEADSKMFNDSSKVQETSNKVVDNSIKLQETSFKVVDNSIKVQKTSNKVVENSIKLHESSNKVADNSIKFQETSIKVKQSANETIGHSIKIEKTGNKVVENVIKMKETTCKNIENFVKTKESSSKIIENSSKTETNSNKVDENSVATSRKKSKKSEKKKSANFDFCKYKKRHVALKFLYLGWDYGGFALQKHTQKTIEEQLFIALMKTKLLENREAAHYHRCGRTDKGVSAFCQVISLDLRSNVHEGKGVITPEDYIDIGRREDELDYPAILNRVLPPEIRVIAWAPVEVDFSARFNCIQRTYKYWFPIGNLDIQKMLEAGQKLVGEHDFRNFCTMDVANGVINYKRKILSVDIKRIFFSSVNEYDIAELTVVGQAFLYHQIRCIMSILCLIGLGKENADVIDSLLDIKKCPRKPQYKIASEIPLVLFDCSYNEDLEWNYNADSLKRVIEHLQSMWCGFSVKSVIVKNMLTQLEKLPVMTEKVTSQEEFLLPGIKPKVYKRLLDRPCCDSLEELMEKHAKKLKLSKELTIVPL